MQNSLGAASGQSPGKVPEYVCEKRGAPKGAAEHYFEESKPIFTKTQFALPTLFPPPSAQEGGQCWVGNEGRRL